jgi:hypothetical protein
MRVDPVVRFARFVERSDGCWLWRGARGGTGRRYGRFKLDGASWPAHRVAYLLFAGPVPDGCDVHHRCGERCCVNPAHLELMVHSVHSGLHDRANRHKETCPRGHPYDAVRSGDGARLCRRCAAAATRRWREGRCASIRS